MPRLSSEPSGSVAAELDAAYARNRELFTGRVAEGSDDDVPCQVNVWPLLYAWHDDDYVTPPPMVIVQPDSGNIRIQVTPASARELASLLVASAERADADLRAQEMDAEVFEWEWQHQAEGGAA